MKFTKPLIKGKLIKRYKRFFTDVKISNEIVTAHCPNTGSMKGLLDEGNEVYVSKNDDPKRKLKYTLEIIKVKKNFNSAILIIGNEILSGRTKDTNTSTIAQWLNSIGVKVNEVRVIPDIEDTIIETVNHLRKVNNYVFTTGGIGPTHDDITAQSISIAFNLNMKFTKKLLKY